MISEKIFGESIFLGNNTNELSHKNNKNYRET